MSARAARGQKRKCQNEECGVSFYDLKRDLFHCPTCDTLFDHEAEAELRAEKHGTAPDHIRRKRTRDLPIVAIAESTDDTGADSEAGDGEVVADDDAAANEAADILLEADEDDAQDPLADAVSLSDADDEDG